MKKNKILLLNSFFDSESKIRNIKNNINIQNNNQKNKKIFKNTETNRDFSNFLKKRCNTDNNINNEKGRFKNKILQNKVKNNKTMKEDNTNTKFIKDDDLDDIINIFIININMIDYGCKQKTNIPMITRIKYRSISKIPHLRQKITEKKELYSINNINQNNTNYSLNKKSSPNRKYISKY